MGRMGIKAGSVFPKNVLTKLEENLALRPILADLFDHFSRKSNFDIRRMRET
jgi:hypothetical protein